MNKKFSTLLAAFLVAGGLGSSAFAQSTTYPINKYVQLKIDGKPLVVGESAVRDSLAFVKTGTLDLYEYNQTLWKFVVEPRTNSNGLTNGYRIYLENKVNGPVALTLAGADANKSFYYAPGAVVSTGKFLLKEFNLADKNTYLGFTNDAVTAVKLDPTVSFTNTNVIYEAASKTLKFYYLEADGTKIKLMLKTKSLADVKLTDQSVLDAQINAFKSELTSGGIVSETINIEANPTAFDVTAAALNKIGNDAFDLSFNKDISSNAQFANPFTASSLHAVEGADVYFAASYDVEAELSSGKSYKARLEAANKVVANLKQLKTDAASFVREMKVAIDEEGSAEGLVMTYAPNEEDIERVNPAEGDLLDLLKADGDAYKAISNNVADAYGLVETAGQIEYESVNVNLGTTLPASYEIRVADPDAAAKSLDDALAKVNTELDKVIKSVETAVNAYNEAVTNSMKSYNLVESNSTSMSDAWVDFTDFAAYDKTSADKLLEDAAKLLVDGNDLTFLKAKVIEVTPSKAVSSVTPTFDGYYPLEVVGSDDMYVTVDTVYAASREKYLTLNTVKFDKVAVYKSGADANKPVKEDVPFDETKHKYVLVPSAGHNLIPALFKVDVNPLVVGNDEITIYANAPKALDDATLPGHGTDNAPKFFNQYKDAASYYDLGETTGKEIKVVIRTLAGAREASVMVPEEDDAVLKNTKITFAEPVLASKINDGDIYFIINKNAGEKENYDKYAVVDPVNGFAYAKESYVNVPATQWYVEKNNDTYELKNRDFRASYDLGAGKIYVVDEDNMLYTTNTCDTFQLVAADVEREGHLGYKYISEEIQKISEFALSAVNYANVETPYYLTFNGNEDSILTATSNKEEALALIPMIVDGKQVTEEYEMNDENLTKQYYQLIAKDGKDTLYLTIGDENMLTVTKEVPEVTDDSDARLYLQFRSINDEPNAYEVLLVADNGTIYESEAKLSYNQDGEAVVIDNGTAAAFVYDLVDNSSDIYKNFGFEGSTKVIISLNGDAESKVTKIGPFATVKRTGLDETIDADYSLIMDTAYVDHKDNIRYAYYITKPIVAADTAWNAEKFYLVSYADSVAANRSNDTIKYSQDGLTRIGFVAAKRLGADSLAITKAVGAAAADTLNVTDKLGVTNATFAFAIDENNDEAYRIEVAPAKYVSYLNGILVEGAKEQAQLFNVNATDLTPTDNEEISVEADGVQVIGGKGAVTVQGAAGKTVTVYNFQGRALASTTLTSDNQTIAVPAGLVAVSVEGEPEAISVVVK